MGDARLRAWRIAGGLAALTLVAFANTARADDRVPTADDLARAQQLFDSAIAEAAAGSYVSACPKFAASHEIDPKTSTLMNLGTCYESLGRLASAWGAFREAEGLARKAGRTDLEAKARASADALVPKLVRLTIVVPEASRTPGLVVSRDGSKLASAEWSVAVPVDVGEHEIVAEAPGRTPWRERVEVHASRSVQVPALKIAPVAAVAPSGDSPSSDARPASSTSWWTPMRTTGAVVAGAGTTSVLTGLVLALVAKSNYDDARDGCAAVDDCPRDAVRSGESARSLATVGTVVIVSGAAVAAVGAALIVLAPPRREASARPSATLAVGPGGLGVIGRW